MELNPNHIVTSAMREHRMKLAAALVSKSGGHVVISMHDLQNMSETLFLTVQELHDGIHLDLVDEATAHAVAKKEGGLPL